MLFRFFMLETIYLSKLKIISPHSNAKKPVAYILLNTVCMAYPPANAAKIPVNRMVAPMPANLAPSVGHLLSSDLLAPAHNQRKELM